MPIWHASIKTWKAKYDLAVLGVTQEQHADRCRLFAQWHGIDWPILFDPFNEMGNWAVPIFVAIDEYGIVRAVGASQETFERDFLHRTFEDDAGQATQPLIAPRDDRFDIETAIETYGGRPADAIAQFRLGVVYRMRFDAGGAGGAGGTGDFQRAIDCWQRALDLNPNQYIWRRRIQQYGPRLDKPYPFFDWVTEARATIVNRGETPITLSLEPYGAEIAHPNKTFQVDDASVDSPDADGKIHRDVQMLITIDAAAAPRTIKPGDATRVHLTLRPVAAWWNNEAQPLRVWIDPPDGWRISKRLLSAAPGKQAESRETRRLDFEVQAPADAHGETILRGYALYYVCEKQNGTCLYLRQDLSIPVTVR